MSSEFTTPDPPEGIDTTKSIQEQMAQAQKILDAAKEAGEPSAIDPEDILVPEVPETPEVEYFGPSDEELGITEDVKTAFFESILAGGDYYEEFPLFDGKVIVGFRSRTAGESEECLLQAGQQGAETVVDYELHLTLRYLAYSLVSIRNKEKGEGSYDDGTLEQRVAKLRGLPTPLYTALMELNNKFDRKLGRLSQLCVQPDFWQPVTAS
jgi:hypothetical protein